jgi:hypothetical protein
MTPEPLDRRTFFRLAGGAAAAAAVMSAGVTLVPVPAEADLWGVELKVLTEHEGLTLLKVSRTIYPHRTLADLYYAGVVKGLDEDAQKAPDTAKLLKDGVAALDRAVGVQWIDLSASYKLVTLQAQPKLRDAVKGKALVALYDNPLVWRHFGYEGPSFQYGGYLHRGFNDLTWLPDPPDEASPKVG